MTPRPYQERTLAELDEWFRDHKTGNPCLELPTGSGKSVIIAEFCRRAVQAWPSTRILMLTHVRELISQNAEKMLKVWPNAPMGIYSAGLGLRQLGENITFAGIQSVRKKADDLGHIDLVIIDECHLINHDEDGGYRSLIRDLTTINPRLRVIGLTATPYRLGHGLITDRPAIFTDILRPTHIPELIHGGFLAPLRSKLTKTHFNLGNVHLVGGEYNAAELQVAVNKPNLTKSVVAEIMQWGEDRRSWLIFCTGVDHAGAVRDELLEEGVSAATVTGDTPTAERDKILASFKAGRLRAVTNCSVLTTGFDHPNLDLIAALRPTKSPGLYVQMAGRGMRVKAHAKDCLFLDFAGLVEMHGPITAIVPPKRRGEGDGTPPIKSCPTCYELVAISVMTCPSCGFVFARQEEDAPPVRKNDDIMGVEASEFNVKFWAWDVQKSKSSGLDMFVVTYHGGTYDKPISEYFVVNHPGYAGKMARAAVAEIAQRAGVPTDAESMGEFVANIEAGKSPSIITHRKDGKYTRVMERKWT